MSELLKGWYRLPYFHEWHLVFNHNGNAESACKQIDMSKIKIKYLDYIPISPKKYNCIKCQRIWAELQEVC